MSALKAFGEQFEVSTSASVGSQSAGLRPRVANRTGLGAPNASNPIGAVASLDILHRLTLLGERVSKPHSFNYMAGGALVLVR